MINRYTVFEEEVHNRLASFVSPNLHSLSKKHLRKILPIQS